MLNDNGCDPFDYIALFNTFMGLLNYEKNTDQHKEQGEMQEKLDRVLTKLERIERVISDGEPCD
jgi:hypothetical protein